MSFKPTRPSVSVRLQFNLDQQNQTEELETTEGNSSQITCLHRDFFLQCSQQNFHQLVAVAAAAAGDDHQNNLLLQIHCAPWTSPSSMDIRLLRRLTSFSIMIPISCTVTFFLLGKLFLTPFQLRLTWSNVCKVCAVIGCMLILALLCFCFLCYQHGWLEL